MSTRVKGDKHGHSTLENEIYGVKWLVCRRCGMRSGDVAVAPGDGTETQCRDFFRCTRAIQKKPLSDDRRFGEAKGPNDE